MIRVTLALLLLSAPAHAALSGFYDSAEKITTILQSEDVANALRQQPIWSLAEEGKSEAGFDLWLVRTQECDLRVELSAEGPGEGMVGMTSYMVESVSGCE